jgi:hypothetical protein
MYTERAVIALTKLSAKDAPTAAKNVKPEPTICMLAYPLMPACICGDGVEYI